MADNVLIPEIEVYASVTNVFNANALPGLTLLKFN